MGKLFPVVTADYGWACETAGIIESALLAEREAGAAALASEKERFRYFERLTTEQHELDVAARDRAEAALETAASWLERWGTHIGRCSGGSNCTCGLVAVTHEVREALEALGETP
jgi:hypothetical protein